MWRSVVDYISIFIYARISNEGVSTVTESNRFKYVSHQEKMVRMGSNRKMNGI